MYKSYSFNIVPYNTVPTLCQLTQQIRHCILKQKMCACFFHKLDGLDHLIEVTYTFLSLICLKNNKIPQKIIWGKLTLSQNLPKTSRC